MSETHLLIEKIAVISAKNPNLVNYQISDWNQLKKELVSWNTVLDRPSVKKVRELVLA